MRKLSKSELWKALHQPSRHACENCLRYQGGGMKPPCHLSVDCRENSESPYIASSDSEWIWDGKTK